MLRAIGALISLLGHTAQPWDLSAPGRGSGRATATAYAQAVQYRDGHYGGQVSELRDRPQSAGADTPGMSRTGVLARNRPWDLRDLERRADWIRLETIRLVEVAKSG